MMCWKCFFANRVATCTPMPGPEPKSTKVLVEGVAIAER
jgi:hypothetical protein